MKLNKENKVENLITVIADSNIEEETAIELRDKFMPFFEEAETWKKEAEKIVVSDSGQIEDIKKAREIRLSLKNIRVDVEKIRKTLKEESLRKGKAIDGMANIVKFLIVPIEEHLKNQEDFVKLQEEKKLKEIYDKRVSELEQYEVDVNLYNIKDMTKEAYSKLLNDIKSAYNARMEAEAKEEAERIEKEKSDAEENERIRIENEKLKKEKSDAEAEANAERIKREAVEAENKRKEDEIEKQKAEAEAERIKQEREKKQAPDKEKLKQLRHDIVLIEIPTVEDEECKKILEYVKRMLLEIDKTLREIS